MAGLKYYERTKLLIELIEKRKTGSPKELAIKLGLKERMVYNVLEDLELALGQDICYSKEKKSYIFSEKNS
jgi:transcriptional antiterminator